MIRNLNENLSPKEASFDLKEMLSRYHPDIILSVRVIGAYNNLDDLAVRWETAKKYMDYYMKLNKKHIEKETTKEK